MKKLLVGLFIFTFVIISNKAEVNAEFNGQSEIEVNSKLLELGLTMEQVGYLNWETKLEIAKEESAIEILSFEHSTHNFSEEGKGNGGLIQPFALKDDLSLNIVTINMGKKDGVPYIKLVADYNWISMPFWRLHDGLVITWSPGWYGDSWGFTEQQRHPIPNAYGSYDYQWRSTSVNAREEDRVAGIGWLYDLKTGTVGSKGTAHVFLKGNDLSILKNTTYSGFKAHYAHDKVASNLGFEIGYGAVGAAASVDFGGEEFIQDSTSIRNSILSY